MKSTSRTNSIAVIEEFSGQQLTPAFAETLSVVPWEQMSQFAATFAPVYYDWLDNETQRRKDDKSQIFHCLDPYPQEAPWRQRVARVKNMILFFPQLTMPDPMADLMWPAMTAAEVLGDFSLDERKEEEFRSKWGNAVRLLADLQPLVTAGYINLIPAPFVVDLPEIQENARKAVDSITSDEVHDAESLDGIRGCQGMAGDLRSL